MIDEAKALAIRSHAGQKYGDKPYATHLYAVVQVLRDINITSPQILSAAWLHDAVEDTDVTVDDIRTLCGDRVAEMVWACTGVGENRKARNLSIYDKIAKCPEAANVKVADRIANVENSQGGELMKMYAKESAAFDGAVCIHADRWLVERLNRAYR